MGSWSDCRDCGISYDDGAYESCPLCEMHAEDERLLEDWKRLLEVEIPVVCDELREVAEKALADWARQALHPLKEKEEEPETLQDILNGCTGGCSIPCHCPAHERARALGLL